MNPNKMMEATSKSSVFPYFSEKAPKLWTPQSLNNQDNVEAGSIKCEPGENVNGGHPELVKKSSGYIPPSHKRLMKRTSLYEDALLSGIIESKEILRQRLIAINKECPLDSMQSVSNEASDTSGKQCNQSDMASDLSEGSLDHQQGQSSQASSDSRHAKSEQRGTNSVSSLTSTELTNASSLGSGVTVKQRESMELQILQKGKQHNQAAEEKQTAIGSDDEDINHNNSNNNRNDCSGNSSVQNRINVSDSLDDLINESVMIAHRNAQKNSNISSNLAKRLATNRKINSAKRHENGSFDASSISQAAFSLKSRDSSQISLDAKAIANAKEAINGFTEPTIAEGKPNKESLSPSLFIKCNHYY